MPFLDLWLNSMLTVLTAYVATEFLLRRSKTKKETDAVYLITHRKCIFLFYSPSVWTITVL